MSTVPRLTKGLGGAGCGEINQEPIKIFQETEIGRQVERERKQTWDREVEIEKEDVRNNHEGMTRNWREYGKVKQNISRLQKFDNGKAIIHPKNGRSSGLVGKSFQNTV